MIGDRNGHFPSFTQLETRHKDPTIGTAKIKIRVIHCFHGWDNPSGFGQAGPGRERCQGKPGEVVTSLAGPFFLIGDSMMISGKTVPKSLVSNGQDVATADVEGNYCLPRRGTHVYCVATPGYSPFKGGVVQLSGTDQSYDLLPEPCDHPRGDFVFAQMADCHLAEPGSETTSDDSASTDLFDTALRQVLREAKPDFVMLTGDQVQKGTLAEISRVDEVIRSVGLPAVHVNGNHEGDVDRDESVEVDPEGKNFDTYFGPRRFAFFWGRYLFIVLDSMSSLKSEHHEWLGSLLARIPVNTPLVVSIHHPDKMFWWFPELFDHNLQLVISGHYHIPRTFLQDGVLHSSLSPALMGGIDSFPPTYRAYRMPADARARITYHTATVNCPPALRGFLIRAIDCPHQAAKMDGLGLCWRQKLDGAVKHNAPLVADGRILVAPHDLDADPIGRLQVFDLDTGKLLWGRRIGDGFFGGPVIFGGHVGELDPQRQSDRVVWRDFEYEISQTPAVSRCHAVGQSITGGIYCLSLNNGNILWEQHLGPPGSRYCMGPVVVSGDWVIVGDAGLFAAFELHTGQQQWIWPKDPLARMAAFYSGGTAAGDGVVLVGEAFDNHGVTALDVQTGEMRWRSGNRDHARYGDAVFADGCFYFFGPFDLICLEAKTGKMRWATPSDPWSYPKPLVHDGKVFAAPCYGGLWALDQESGRALWRTQSGKPPLPLACNATERVGQLAAPVAWNKHILLASGDGTLYIVEAETGKTSHQFDFGIPLTSAPVLHGNYLVINTADATLWKFKLPA